MHCTIYGKTLNILEPHRPSQPIVAYESCVLSGESENTNLIVFDLQH
jgi:hypothetical protein